MEFGVDAVERCKERLINLIDLQSLKPTLEGRPVLSPFLQTIKTSSTRGGEKGDVRKLLDFVCDSGHIQAVSALTSALKAETTHPGHAEAYEILLQAAAEPTVPSALSEYVASTFHKCLPLIIEKLDFNAVIPLLLHRGLITQDAYSSIQAPYVSTTEKAEALLNSFAKAGIKGVVDFISALQATPSKEHETIAEHIKDSRKDCMYNLSITDQRPAIDLK